MKGEINTGSTKSTPSASAMDHDYNRSLSPELTPFLISNPDTPDRPADKKHKRVISRGGKQV